VATPPNVDAIASAVDDLKVAADYAHDAVKTPAELHTYVGQAATALQAAQKAMQAAMAAGGSADLRANLQQLQQQLDKVTPDVQAAASATTLAAAESHTAAMQLASHLDLLPLALDLRLQGSRQRTAEMRAAYSSQMIYFQLRWPDNLGANAGTEHQRSTITWRQAQPPTGCAVVCHTSFSSGQRISDLQMIVPDVSSRPLTLLLDTWHNGRWTLGYAR
jgi:hypothetical protein